MSDQAQFDYEVTRELAERQTCWVCVYCGLACEACEPSTFTCCGEVGHVEEVDAETGEPV